jgi:hypothetical protein
MDLVKQTESRYELTEKGFKFLCFLHILFLDKQHNEFTFTVWCNFPNDGETSEEPSCSAIEKIFLTGYMNLGDDLCCWCVENKKTPVEYFLSHFLSAAKYVDDETKEEFTNACNSNHYLSLDGHEMFEKFEKEGKITRVNMRLVVKKVCETNVIYITTKLYDARAANMQPREGGLRKQT